MLEHLAEEDEMVPDMRRSFTQQEERQVRFLFVTPPAVVRQA